MAGIPRSLRRGLEGFSNQQGSWSGLHLGVGEGEEEGEGEHWRSSGGPQAGAESRRTE